MVILAALIGAVVGSFLNVVIDRVPRRQSLLRPGSHCPSCGRALGARDLVPLLSYIALGGKCRTCHASIPRRVPAVEAATAALFALLWGAGAAESGNGMPASPKDALWLAVATVYSCVMVILFVIDLEHRRVPNLIVLPAIALALTMAPALAWLAPRYAHHGLLEMVAPSLSVAASSLVGQIAGGVTAFAIFWGIWRVAPQGMGAGDVKLAGFAGLIAGFPCALAAVFGSFVLGGVVGAGLLLTGRAGRKTAIPFAPFLIVTTFVVMVCGDALLAWYLGR